MGELTTPAQGRQLDAAQPSQSQSMLATIAAAASDPNVDAAKMQTLAELAIKLQTHEQQQQFNRDLNAAILEMPVISRDGRITIRDKNTQAVIQSTPFARFEDIDRVVRPICARHNLTYSFEVGGDAQRMTVRPIIRHANGFVERGEAMPLPLETSGSKNNVQGAGSSVTYGKRYALCAAFSIVTEGLDTDGNGQPVDVSLPHERQQLVLQEAEAAAAAGHYQEHFTAQSPRDRAWLVQHGHHARLGGVALPPPVDRAEPTGQRADRPPPADAADKARADWCRRYVANVDKAADRDALMELQLQHEEKLTAIRTGYPELQAQIVAAHERALARLES